MGIKSYLRLLGLILILCTCGIEQKDNNSYKIYIKKITGHKLVMILGDSPKLNKKDSFLVKKKWRYTERWRYIYY